MYPPTNPASNAPRNPEIANLSPAGEANVDPSVAIQPPTNPTASPGRSPMLSAMKPARTGIMEKVRIKYGKEELHLRIPDRNFSGMVCEKKSDIADESLLLADALMHPMSSPRLQDIIHCGEKAVIVTSDITRPTPSRLMLPPVIDELTKAGLCENDITIVLALGTHRKHTEKEKRFITGDKIYESNIRILDSDVSDCINMGT